MQSCALEQIAKLRQLRTPEPRLVGAGAPAPTYDELATSRFTIESNHFVLHSPVDWQQDPFKSRSWCFQLNTLTWLKPQLIIYARSGNHLALTSARDLVMDWVTAHAEQEADNEFAWYDMAVGLRAPYLAYVLRACLLEELLSDDDAVPLLNMAARHGTELAKEENYAEGHNHGLFQDEGLYLLAQQLPVLPSAPSWRDLAANRLRLTLSQTICTPEGGHLEHSSSYQFSITALVSRLADTIQELADLSDLRDRLKATSQWHVMPGGRIAQLGDTDDVEAPAWAREGAQSLHGMKAFLGTGQAFVRDGASYLAVTAAYHSAAHKHADETGFLLVEDEAVLLGDAGRWGYYEDESDRKYARSASAHNVMLVDHREFQWHGTAPYGSGLLATGHDDAWYGILVENPTFRYQGVTHRRLFLYQPQRSLLIIDDVQADKPHEYTRYFHFGPTVTAELCQSGLALSSDHTSATFTDIGMNTSFSLHRGVDDPRRLGWTYPADRARTEVFTAVLHTYSAQSILAASLAIGENGIHLAEIEKETDQFLLKFNNGNKLAVLLLKNSDTLQIVPEEKLA